MKRGDQVKIELPALDIQTLTLTVIGDTPLICHAWSEKAKKQMRDRQTGKAQQKKAAKSPDQDFKDSLYPIGRGKYGFPSVAFKSAAVSAARHIEGLKMTELRGALHILGDMVEIVGTPTMREDMVRIAMGTADIRYRGEFKTWKAKVTIRFNARMLTPEMIAGLFNAAGFGVGVGEWRPERNGSFGCFHVASGKEAA
jgi:hypothetical protein